MLSAQENERVDQAQIRLEQMRKAVKSYQKYLADNWNEVDASNRKILTLSKTYQQQVSLLKDDPLNLGINLNETILLFDYSAKIITQQQSDFHTFFSQAFDDYFDKWNSQSRRVNDLNQNNLKALLATRQAYVKAKKHYEKLCKEVETSVTIQKKSQNEANSGYNVELANKTENRMRDILKQVTQAEQIYKDQTEAAVVKQREFQEGLTESQTLIKQFFKYSNEKLLEITMKQDQHNLLSYNWIKGHIDERFDKIVMVAKFDSAQEDGIIQQRIDSNQQDLVMKQTQIKFIDILARLMGEQQGTIQDLEYMMFPDVLSKFIEVQMTFINERVKNLRNLSAFLGDMYNCYDVLQKSIGKIVKAGATYMQDQLQNQDTGSSVYGRKLLQIQDSFIGFHENFSKRIYQLCQFLQIKQQTMENMLKEQKGQEKSFQNMYQKLVKDIFGFRNQLQGAMFEQQDQKLAAQMRDQLQTQLKKIIKESAPVLKYSLEQVRSAENTRSQQISTIIEGIVQQYNLFIDDTIKNTKVQEEALNKRYDGIEQEQLTLPPLTQPQDCPEVGFAILLTEEQRLQVEQVFNISNAELPILQQSGIIDEEDDRNLEDGAVKVNQKLLQKFKVGENEKCISSYSCAFENKILLQGRIYIFTNRICFHSYFNAKTLFGVTILVVPPNDIITIRKAKVYLVDRGIEIQTKKGALVFTSLIQRDQTFAQMKLVKGLAESVFESAVQLDELPPQIDHSEDYQDQNQNQPIQHQQQLIEPPIEQTSEKQQIEQKQELPIQTQVLQNHHELIQKSPPTTYQKQLPHNSPQSDFEINQFEPKPEPPKAVLQNPPKAVVQNPPKALNDKLKQEIMVAKHQERTSSLPGLTKYTLTLPVSVQELVETIFMDSPYTCQGKRYRSFFDYFQTVFCKDRELQIQPYAPKPSIEAQSTAKRQLTFLHPVREKVMFAPESAFCTANDQLFFFNEEEALQEREVFFSKIPYGDHFKFRSYFHIKGKQEAIEHKHCSIEYGFVIVFIKKTVWQGKIESSSKSENIEWWEKLLKPCLIKEAEHIVQKRHTNQIAIEQPIKSSQQAQPELISDIIDDNKEQPQKIEQPNGEEQLQSGIDQKVEPEPAVVQPLNQEQSSELDRKIQWLTQLAYVIIGLALANLLATLAR